MKYPYNPIKNNCLRRVKMAIKNGQRNGNIREEMAKLGFTCYLIGSATSFYKYLVKLSAKRRRSVLRVARAAIKRNDLANIHSFNMFKDFRDIKFDEESRVADAKSRITIQVELVKFQLLQLIRTARNSLTLDEIHAIVEQAETKQ